MQPYINQNPLNNERDHDFHDKCRKHLYQFVQVELKDGTIYQGILHSHDREKMYLLMPKMHHEHHHHNSMHHEHHHHNSMHMDDESSSRQFFPFFGPFGLFGFPFFGVRRFGPFFPFFI
jgi:hypothetical protein